MEISIRKEYFKNATPMQRMRERMKWLEFCESDPGRYDKMKKDYDSE